MHAATRVLTATLAFAAASLAHAQGGPDELWDMSTRMEMAGMPGQTFKQQSCMKKGQTQPDKFSQDKNCKVTESKTVGNKVTWKIVCTGRDAMTGEGEVTRTKDKMDGRIRMQGKQGKDTFDMTTVLSGRLVGGCTWEDPGKQMAAMQAQSDAMLAKECRAAMEKYQTMLFDGPAAACKAQKAEYCTQVTKMTQSMRTPAGYRSAMKVEALRGQGWEQTAQVCGVKPEPIRAEACKGAVGGRDWPFVAEQCPADAKKIAAEQCAGRGYTAAMESEYKAVCQRYLRAASGDSDSSSTGSSGSSRTATAPKPKPQAEPPAAPAAPSAADTVKEGANQLRKLFGR